VVLTNRDLTTLVLERPDSLAALGRVRGIGKAKVGRHGQALLALLRGEAPPAEAAKADRDVSPEADQARARAQHGTTRG